MAGQTAGEAVVSLQEWVCKVSGVTPALPPRDDGLGLGCSSDCSLLLPFSGAWALGQMPGSLEGGR